MVDFLHTSGVILILCSFVYFMYIVVNSIPKETAVFLAATVIGLAFLVLLTLWVQPSKMLGAMGLFLLGFMFILIQ